MLNFFLILFCIVVWIALYALYFRKEIRDWIENRFGKDEPATSDEPPAPISYKVEPKQKVDG